MTTIQSSITNYESHLLSEGKNPNTVKKYVRDVNRLFAYLSEYGRELDQSSLEDFLRDIQESGYSSRSVNSVIASIKSFCKFEKRTDLHCKSLNLRKKNNQDVQMHLTQDEYEALLHTALNNENYEQVLLIEIFAMTELRMNELCYLTVDAMERGVVTVPRVGEPYEIFMPVDLIEDLCDYIDFQGIHEGIIFRTGSGKALDRSYIWRQLKDLAVDAKVDPKKVYPQNLKRQMIRKHFFIEYPN